MGSVKDVVVLREPSSACGEGRFIFSDRFSVFDYGVMPDLIEDKGKALCMVAAYFFERMDDEGIANHYIGLVEDGKLKRFDEVSEATNVMQIKLVRVIKPIKKNGGYDYSVFRGLTGNFLLPLEVIYRNSIPEGSSLLRRVERGEVKPQDFGLERIEVGQKLDRPIVDFSTKLEDVDRYLSYDEAKSVAALSDEEFEKLKEITLKVNWIITREVSKAGLENEDGKIEFAFDEKRELMVVDAVGTPDECRFTLKGFEVSKEILRKYYRRTEWYMRLRDVRGKEGWRDLAGQPPKLPQDVKAAISDVYRAFCNEITGKKFFDAPKLNEVVRQLEEVLQ